MMNNEYVVDVIEKMDIQNQIMIHAAQWHNTSDYKESALHNEAFFEYTHTLNNIRKRFRSLVRRNKVTQQESDFVNKYIDDNTKMLVSEYNWPIQSYIQDLDGSCVRI